jgi:hypothetical protein
MKNKERIMYKKLLLATAITVASGQALGATWAADTGTVGVIHTNEGISKVAEATGVPTASPVVRLGAAYAVNDVITLTYSVAKASTASWPTNLYSIKPGTAVVTHEVVGVEAIGQVEVATQTRTGNTAGVAGFVVGDVCTFGGRTTEKYRVEAITGITANHIKVTPALITATAADDTVICANPEYVILSYTSGSTDGKTVNYRVQSSTAVGTATSSIGAEIPLPSPNVSVAGLTAADATVSFAAATGAGTAMDVLTTSKTIATASPEFSYAVSKKFNAVIDVETDRKSYSSAFDTTNVEDDLELTITLVAGTDGNKATTTTSGVADITNAVTLDATTASSAVTTVVGDFAFLDSSTAAGVTAAAAAFTENNANSTAIATTGASYAITDTTIAANVITSTVKNTEAAVLPVQSFTASTVVTFTSEGIATATRTIDHGNVGSWTLNGASVTAYGVPMGPAVSRFLWISNKGTASAAFTYTATMNGTSYGPYSVGTVPGKTSMSVAGLIDTDLSARGIYVAPSSRATIELASPVKANDITVSASYKHIGDSDRLGLETSDTLTILDAK